VKGSKFCPRHAEQAKQVEYETKKSDPIWMLYQTPRWKKFRLWFIRLHPQCQRIIDGKQCENFSHTVHHRISPRQRPDLFTDADNVKAVCRKHHPNHEGDVGDEVYTESRTKYALES
jgi:hypothetical protein